MSASDSLRGRVVVTGYGVVSALGVGKEATLQALREGRSGIGPVRHLATAHREYPVGEVPLSNGEMRALLGIADSEPTTRTALMGSLALREALAQAGLGPEALGTVDLVGGTTVGGMDKSERYYLDFLSGDSRNAYIRTHDCGACTEMTAATEGPFRRLTTLSTACSSAANAVLLGATLIESGESDCVVVGGSECITMFHLNGFHSLMILDREPCRPFDSSRAGLNLGEGAAWLVLEREGHALARGAAPLALLAGYGNACDAFHQTATSADGEGPFLAMKQALERAGIAPSEVDYINAHGTGTANNDATESAAIRRLFDVPPPVSSTKAFTGHTTSASGTIEAAICLLAMEHAFLPVNLRFREAGDCLTPVTDPRPPRPLRYVLNNSFGFGGNDTALLLAAYRPAGAAAVRLHDGPPRRKVYLLAGAQVSAQEPLCDRWAEAPLPLAEGLNRSREADYKRFVPPLEARRLGRILKRAIATAAEAVRLGGLGTPQAIVTGTGLGCIENTELFLDALCRLGEDQMMPTRFMQSTHNTMSSLVAIHLQAHGYNATYAHHSISFQSALLDALLQLRLGRVGNALVCAHDELTPAFYSLLRKGGYYASPAEPAAECAASLVLAAGEAGGFPTEPLCEVAGVALLHRPTAEAETETLKRLMERCALDPGATVVRDGGHYLPLFGKCHTVPALHLYAAARTLGPQPLVLRHREGGHLSLIALKPAR